MSRTFHHADRRETRPKDRSRHAARRSRDRGLLARLDWDEMAPFESNAGNRTR